ncbi:D-beta-D-heptose 1-phosphate adenosyltransferase [Arthrobacter sp. Soil782]|uniref:DeoR/GlpR family DNA-binding transcription regulator n=1 Tax=Arthrobacter sp. Soil782 TaxID=1736410 RepID=UPI0006F902A3|nr:DeoR/GlpR family DNA-binding transcription regulator [Arthrobacter sp. Soil782]KRF09529.1 D-beta-D-heptose 1-phosphate adenosyltransferase [Arthrobacter sp. Soil782]
MFAEERYNRIAALVMSEGRVTVAQLASRFNITKETVRRDLALLEKDGLLRRVHGGAVPAASASTTELSLTSREGRNQAEKARIAKAALTMVPTEGSIVLDGGTTTSSLAALLAQEAGNQLLVITHSVPVASTLIGSSLQLEFIGGRVRGLTSACVGSGTVARYSGFRPDVVFIGTNGVHPEFGLSTPDPEEASVKAAIVRSARRVVVLADASKLNTETLVSFAELGDMDALVTDAQPDTGFTRALAEADVELVIA